MLQRTSQKQTSNTPDDRLAFGLGLLDQADERRGALAQADGLILERQAQPGGLFLIVSGGLGGTFGTGCRLGIARVFDGAQRGQRVRHVGRLQDARRLGGLAEQVEQGLGVLVEHDEVAGGLGFEGDGHASV